MVGSLPLASWQFQDQGDIGSSSHHCVLAGNRVVLAVDAVPTHSRAGLHPARVLTKLANLKRLHADEVSANLQSVNTARICIAEAKLENEVEFVNHEFKQVWSEEWRKHQPFNQMPYMLNNDTGYTIYESRAISKCES